MSEPITTSSPQAPRVTGARRPPGPRRLGLLGSALDIGRNALSFSWEMWQRYGDVVRTRFLFAPAYLLFHPDHVKRVLQDNHRHYDKQFPTMGAVRNVMGNGLFLSDGESWLHQRRLMQPTFHRKRVAALGTLMTDATLALLTQWQERAECDQPLDIPKEMTHLTLHIVGQALFHVDLSAQTALVGQSFTELLPLLLEYSSLPFPPLFLPTARNRRIQSTLNMIDTIVYQILNERREHPLVADTTDLLSMLLSARDEETGLGMTDQQVRDEVISLLLGGHETTTTALTWIWYLLSQHPEVEQRLHAELDTVLGSHPPTVEHLPNLPYLSLVIQEAMRLYPPVFGFARHSNADDQMGEYHIAAQSMVFVMPYWTHRHPAYWEEPERFDPERFTPERSAHRPRFAYFPFGGGPRQCLGNTFALMEIQLVLATIAQRYRLRLVPAHPVEPKAAMTLRPRYGLPMIVSPRQAQ